MTARHQSSHCYSLLPLLLIIMLVMMSPAAIAQATAAGAEAMNTMAELVQNVVQLAIGIIGTVAFLIVAWAILGKFNDARRGRAEWGEVALPFLFGAAALVLIGYMTSQALEFADQIDIGGEASLHEQYLPVSPTQWASLPSQSSHRLLIS